LKYHLDTSFLIDWQRDDPAVDAFVQDILAGLHDISVTGVAYTEFMAAAIITPRKRAVAATVVRIGEWLPISLEASRLASRWMAPMNREQRRAFFADALISAASHVHGATLLSGDKTAAGIFPASVELYK
jgi:predicted nucleic acid-binding protein